MSGKKNRLFSKIKPELFESKYVRYDPEIYLGNDEEIIANQVTDITNSSKKEKLTDASYDGIYGTQQINIDYTDFSNFTFFDSAVSKTNIAFDRIINNFPYDGTKEDIDEFIPTLTGFERSVLDSIPKSVSYLNFSGTQVGEDPANGYDAALGTHLIVKNIKGYETFNTQDTDGGNVLNIKDNDMSVEMYVNIPSIVNDCQTIFTLASDTYNGISLSLSASSNTETCVMSFDISSGSTGQYHSYINSTVNKGSFDHYCFTFNRQSQEIKMYVNGEENNNTNSNFDNIQDMVFNSSDTLIIGSGSELSTINHNTNASTFVPKQTFSGSLDEFRMFRVLRSDDEIKDNYKRNINRSKDRDMIAYFRFNEPSGSYNGSNYSLDYSGNSLHTKIQNYDNNLRVTGSVKAPVSQELLSDNHVLFVNNDGVRNLNTRLLNSASLYDEQNPNIITKLIPPHFLIEGQMFEGLSNITGSMADHYQSRLPGEGKVGSGQLLTSFLLIFAKYYDELKIYVDTLSKSLTIDYDSSESAPDTFLPLVAKNMGIRLPNLFDAKYDQFIKGLNIDDGTSVSNLNLYQVQNEIWKRILLSVRKLNSEKGTLNSVKSLIRSMGLDPDKYFDIKEHGSTYKKRYLDSRRKTVKKSLNYLDMSGSLATISNIDIVDSQGFHTNTPRIISPFLSSSRFEKGFPGPVGSFVSYPESFHGISNNIRDGLLTSGSFTVEGIYSFDQRPQFSHFTSQSLFRLVSTGSNTYHHLLGNVVFSTGSDFSGINFYLDANRTVGNTYLVSASIPDVNILDGDIWHISAGVVRNDDNLYREKSVLSSSIFLRCISTNTGKRYFAEKDIDNEVLDTFQITPVSQNSSGSFIVIGSQSIDTNGIYFLNNSSYSDHVRSTKNSAQINFLRFWSKALTEKDTIEHARNFNSFGTDNPNYSYNHNNSISGSFNKIRADVSVAYQTTTASNSDGEIRLFDYSQNNFHFNGHGFEASKDILKRRTYSYSYLAPKFDENETSEKVRVRGYTEDRNLDLNPYARRSPVNYVFRDEIPESDNRFSIDMSSIKSLDSDIMKLFNSLEYFDNEIGDPRNMYQDTYTSLEHTRYIYFQDLLTKVDIESSKYFFNWFDNQISDLVFQFLPMKTNFLGVNFIIESHVLERPRYRYLTDDQYYYDSIGSKSTNIGNEGGG